MIVQSHVYSEYSLLSSINRIESLVAKAKQLGYKALALSDHHVVYGAVPFYQACLKHDIKPIFGLELTIQQGDEDLLVLLRLYAKNERGYSHLMKLATVIGHKKMKDPFLTRTEVEPYLNDLLVILPYDNGPLTTWLLKGQYEKASEWLMDWRKEARDSDWFLEVEGDKEKGEQDFLAAFARESGIMLIASHPCFFLEEKDADAFQVARAIRDRVKASDYPLNEKECTYYLQSPEQMNERFKYEDEALENTKLLSSLCSVELTLDQPQLPKYVSEEHVNSEDKLRELCEEGVQLRYGEITVNVRERLERELSVINQMGFNDYFLIVWDFMKYARRTGMLTGPGRGSAAGSLVAYVLQITGVDPLQYDLLFERFLNHERVSMPDIDIDFPDYRRDEMIAYVQRKYGKDHVAQIITFGTLAAKAVIRDVGKALGLTGSVIERVAREIPSRPGVTLDKAVIESKQLATLIDESKDVSRLLELGKQLEGLPKHVSTHAAGVVISARPLPEIVALQSGQSHISLTQAPMNVVEKLGLLKFDFLGLRNLTLLERMLELIKVHHHIKIDLSDIPLDDKETYELLAQGNTTGVFQLESKGMRRALRNLGPSEFEDIVAVNALYRPGPMEFIQTYIDGKYGKRVITYAHEDLEPILKKTYGVIVYQEQIMQIASLLAGFTLAEADLLRRAISKKNKKEIEERREDFLKGIIENGYDKHVAEDVFALIERFANYGFNRSHAVAYSMISYQLAYVKVHYPLVFYTALLSMVWSNHEKLASHLQECKESGYVVLPPSLSKSDAQFTIEEGAIRFGLLPINHVGVQAIQTIIQERKKKEFEDLFDFTVRCDQKKVTKKVVEQLIKAGVMDEFGQDRATLLYSIDEALRFATKVNQFQEETAGLFTIDLQAPHYDQVEPLLLFEKLNLEKEALGFYLSGHPIEPYQERLAKVGRITIQEAFIEEQPVRIAGVVIQVRKIRTKKGEPMAFALLSDETMDINLVLFPQVWRNMELILGEGQLVLIEGRIDLMKDQKQLIVNKGIAIKDLPDTRTSELQQSKDGLFLRITEASEEADPLQEIKKQLLAHKGSVQVILYYERTKKSIRLSADYAIAPNETMLQVLKEILGNANVILRIEKQ